MSAWQEVGDGIFARRYAPLDLNIGLVIGDGGVLVVDTRCHLEEARELRRHIAEVTPLPVRWVVNTHYHWDHTFGNAEFRPAPIWGHRRCATALRDRGRDFKKDAQRWIPADADRFEQVTIDPPDQVFDDRATISLGGRVVEARYLGRAHTDSDVVLLVPDAGVVFAGDVVDAGGPWFRDGYPLEWPQTVHALEGLCSGPVVPGHGPVADGAFVARQQEALAAVVTLARRLEGTSAQDLEKHVHDGPFPPATMRTALGVALAHLQAG